MMKIGNKHINNLLFILLILLYFGASVHMAFRLPGLATPNELLNYEYIQVMRQIRGLPNRGLVDSEIRYTEWHQPPVYFTFAMLVGLAIPIPLSPVNPPPPIELETNPFYTGTIKGNLHPALHITPQTWPMLYTSRLAAAFMGMLALAMLYRAASRLYYPAVGLLVVSLLAFQPNFIHLSASVNNDMPLTAVSAIVLAYTLLLIISKKPPRACLVLGFLCSLAVLTKANGIFVLAYLGTACLALLIRGRQLWPAIQAGLWGVLGFLPLWSGWLVLNTIRMKDTLGLSGSFPVQDVLFLNPIHYRLLGPYLFEMWQSFWLDWSTGQIGYTADWVYIAALLFILLALLGWVRRDENNGRFFPTLAVFLGAFTISYLYFAVKAAAAKGAGYLVPEGRWWLPVMPGLAWLTAIGFGRWWPSKWRVPAVTLAALAIPVTLYALLFSHLPSLYPQAKPLPTTATIPPSQDLIYNHNLQLLAATLPATSNDATLPATLYWQALQDINQDYIVSSQLLTINDDGWQKLAEQNSHPGHGLTPTRGWQAGQIYEDEIVLPTPDNLNGPTQVALAVWALDENGRIIPTHEGQPADPAVIQTTVLRPLTLTVPQPLDEPVYFGDLIQLQQTEIQSTDTGFSLTLWWQTQASPQHDYHVFTHLLDESGQLIAQQDGIPNQSLSPTRIWQPGDIIRDQYHFTVPWPVNGRVAVGIYDPLTGQRLTATRANMSLLDNSYHLLFPLAGS